MTYDLEAQSRTILLCRVCSRFVYLLPTFDAFAANELRDTVTLTFKLFTFTFHEAREGQKLKSQGYNVTQLVSSISVKSR